MRRLALLSTIVAGRWAAAASAPSTVTIFEDLGATPDGGAWLMVESYQRESWGSEVTGSRRVELRRIGRDGTQLPASVPTAFPLRAIATSTFDDSLWVLTTDSIEQRAGDSTWRTIPLDHTDVWARWFGLTTAVVTPIARDRAVVARGCGYHCTDVSIADAAAGTAQTTRLDIRLGQTVADQQGGLWATLNGESNWTPQGYAHLSGGRWEAWRFGKDVDGFAQQHDTKIFPIALAADGRGGVVAATHEELVTIDPGGVVVARTPIPRSEEPQTDQAIAVLADDHGGAQIIEGVHVYSDRDTLDPSPVIRRVTSPQIERVPTSLGWRSKNELGTPAFRVARGGDTLWLLTNDAIFFRTGDHWHAVGVPGGEPTFRKLVSVPLNVGGSLRRGSPNGTSIGVRPELMFAPNQRRPGRALGVFAEVVTAAGTPDRELLLGGGITAASYAHGFAAAASVGGDARVAAGTIHPQLVFSGFVGIRGPANMELPPFEAPFGFRVDVRPGVVDVPGSVTLSLSIDTIGTALIAYGLTGAFSRHD